MQMTGGAARGRHMAMSVINQPRRAGVAELVDALDLKSRDPGSWGFKSPRPHHSAAGPTGFGINFLLVKRHSAHIDIAAHGQNGLT